MKALNRLNQLCCESRTNHSTYSCAAALSQRLHFQSQIYKLAQPKTRGETISEADRGTVMVTTTILNLERQVDAVEREIEM